MSYELIALWEVLRTLTESLETAVYDSTFDYDRYTSGGFPEYAPEHPHPPLDEAERLTRFRGAVRRALSYAENAMNEMQRVHR
jgi:hypothetical protein